MKSFLLLLGLLLTIIPLSSALTCDEYLYSTGYSTAHNTQTWANGEKITSVYGKNSGLYEEGAAGQQIVTGPGRSEIDTSGEMTDGFIQSTTLTSTGPMAAWDSASINSLIPNESEIACTASQLVYFGDDTITSGLNPSHAQADGQVGVMANNGVYQSDKVTDSTSYGLSGRADVNGSFYGDLAASLETGLDKDSDTKNHEDSVRRHVFGASAGKVSGKIDWIWNDYTADSLNVTAGNETVKTAANETEVNNTSVEEAES